MRPVAFVVTALCLGIAMCLGVYADPKGTSPRDVVSAYMDALKAGDVAHAFSLAGVDLPKAMADRMNAMAGQGTKLRWRVTAYSVKDVRVDGGLALVTVEETSARELDESLKASIASTFGQQIKWGEVTVTETFVLVRLGDQWQFDTRHSGIAFEKLPTLSLIEAGVNGTPPPPDVQRPLAELVNGTGVGQVVQSLSSPALGIFAAILIPSFERARAQAQLTACRSNLKNIATSLEMYGTDHEGHFPKQLSALVPAYLRRIPACPATETDTYSKAYQPAVKPDEYTVYCEGHGHQILGYPSDFPKYTSTQGLVEPSPSQLPMSSPRERVSGCRTNLKNLGLAVEMYSADHEGRFPKTIAALVPTYLKSLPSCPSAKTDTYSQTYRATANPSRYSFGCAGSHHAEAGLPAGHPRYTSEEGLIDH